MTAPTITPLPTPPSRQEPDTFADRSDAFVGALPAFQSEANTLGTFVNDAAVSTADDAVSTAADAVTASAAAAAAVLTADAALWVSEASYAAGANAISLVDFGTYRAITTHTGVATDPSADATNWVQISTGSFTGDVTVGGELIAGSYNETYVAVTSTTNATTVNSEAGNTFMHTLTENTTFTFSNPPASGTAYTMSIEIIQDASSSGFTVTWPSSIDWPAARAPTLTATVSAVDVFVFTTRDGGTNWYGFTAGKAFA
jgi:hypothetical protein